MPALVTLETEWKRRTLHALRDEDAAIRFAKNSSLPGATQLAKWTPPARFRPGRQIRGLEVDLEKLSDKLPKPGSAGVSVGQSLLILPGPAASPSPSASPIRPGSNPVRNLQHRPTTGRRKRSTTSSSASSPSPRPDA